MEAISPAKAWIVLARLSSLESLIHDVPVSVTGFTPTPCFRSACTSSGRARLEGECRDLRSAMPISSWYPIRARSRFWSRDILSFSKDKGRRVKLLRGAPGKLFRGAPKTSTTPEIQKFLPLVGPVTHFWLSEMKKIIKPFLLFSI